MATSWVPSSKQQKQRFPLHPASFPIIALARPTSVFFLSPEFANASMRSLLML